MECQINYIIILINQISCHVHIAMYMTSEHELTVS